MNIEVYTRREPKDDEYSVKSLEPLYYAYDAAWRTKWEMAIIENSARICSESDWMEKLEDEEHVNQWVIELRSHEYLLEEHIDYLLAELRYFAKLQRANISIGTMLSAVDMVWTMDIPEDVILAQDFKRNVVDALESNRYNFQAPPISVQCHGYFSRCSNCKVHHLIDPSTYTLLFDMSSLLDCPIKSPLDALNLPSYGRVPGSHSAWKQAIREMNHRMSGDSDFIPINEDYLNKLDPEDRHWLPTDIYVNSDGSVEFKSYISNLHPGKYPEAYKSIGTVITKCLPALEQVLTDWEHRRDLRVPYDPDECLYGERLDRDQYYSRFKEYPGNDYGIAGFKWTCILAESIPIPSAFFEPTRPLTPYSLRNKNLQVVVNMQDAYTHFDRQSIIYDWDADGTASEQIVATAIYFYEVDSSTELSISFRESISGEGLVSDLKLIQSVYLFEPYRERTTNAAFTQQVGKITIKPGLLVCYPNVYQHNIHGDDYHGNNSQPRHIKALTLYFVDPSIRIVSTSVVPPQQKEWWVGDVLQMPRMRSLPWFIQDQIIKDVDMPMSLEQSSAIRKKLYEILLERRSSSQLVRIYPFFDVRIHNGDD